MRSVELGLAGCVSMDAVIAERACGAYEMETEEERAKACDEEVKKEKGWWCHCERM